MLNTTILSKESMTNLVHLLIKRKSIELDSLKSEWKSSLHHLKLGKLVQESLSIISSTESQPIKNGFVKNMIGLSTGYLIEKIYPNKPSGILAKISKLSFEIIAGKLVANNTDKIISIGSFLFKKLIPKK